MFNDELTIRLCQHTPLIAPKSEKHLFLRATELKPKLNRFLLSQYLLSNDFNSPPEEWFIGKGIAENKCLDFAVLGCAINNPNVLIDEFDHLGRPITMIGAPIAKLKARPESDALKIRIQSDLPALLSFIKKHIEEFFIVANFGRRQSKGYGQFTVDQIDQDEKEFDPLKVERVLKTYFTPINGGYYQEQEPIADLEFKPFTTPENWKIYQISEGHYNTVADVERKVYNVLKAGKNKKYTKSKLYRYFFDFLKINSSWEKRAIKEGLQKNHPKIFEHLRVKSEKGIQKHQQVSTVERSDNHSYLFIRALLGLTENYEYWIEKDEEKLANLKIKVNHKLADRTIEQFSSPLKIKLFGAGCDYFIPTMIPKRLYNEPFEFKGNYDLKHFEAFDEEENKDEDKNENLFLSTTEKQTLELNTPAEFDLISFLDAPIYDENAKKVRPIFEHVGLKAV